MNRHGTMTACLRWLLLAVLGAAAMPALAQYQFQRFEEDWSAGDGPPYKFITLQNGDSLSLGGHLRMRAESHRNFRGTQADDDFTLALATVHADYQSGRFRVFAELKAADSLGDVDVLPRGAIQDDIDIEHFFVEWQATPEHILRLGRQTLFFGKPFVHTARWRNTMRRWDGASWLYAGEQWKGRVFWLHEALTRPEKLNRSTSDFRLGGFFTERRLGDDSIELYGIDFLRDRPVRRSGTIGDERRQTLGARYLRSLGKAGRLSMEANLQVGHVGDEDIFAQLYSASYARPLDGGLRVTFRVDVASGDDTPGGEVDSFAPIYDVVHPFAGRLDMLWRSNLIDYSVALSRKAGDLTLAAELHSFDRENRGDAVYAPGGAIVAAVNAGSRHIGEELDLRANWRLSARTSLEAGVSIARLDAQLGTLKRNPSLTYLSLEHRF